METGVRPKRKQIKPSKPPPNISKLDGSGVGVGVVPSGKVKVKALELETMLNSPDPSEISLMVSVGSLPVLHLPATQTESLGLEKPTDAVELMVGELLLEIRNVPNRLAEFPTPVQLNVQVSSTDIPEPEVVQNSTLSVVVAVVTGLVPLSVPETEMPVQQAMLEVVQPGSVPVKVSALAVLLSVPTASNPMSTSTLNVPDLASLLKQELISLFPISTSPLLDMISLGVLAVLKSISRGASEQPKTSLRR
jgi:hypothetical protein